MITLLIWLVVGLLLLGMLIVFGLFFILGGIAVVRLVRRARTGEQP